MFHRYQIKKAQEPIFAPGQLAFASNLLYIYVTWPQ